MFINNLGKKAIDREFEVGCIVVSNEDGRCYLVVEIDSDSHYNSVKTTYGLMNMASSVVVAQYDSLWELKEEQVYSEDLILYPDGYKLILDK